MKCLNCLLIIILIIVLSIVGIFFYLNKGCGVTIDKIIATENLDYTNGTKWLIHGNNSDYVVANDFLFSLMKPSELINQLEVGKTYKLKTCGWEIPLIKYNKIVINTTEIK